MEVDARGSWERYAQFQTPSAQGVPRPLGPRQAAAASAPAPRPHQQQLPHHPPREEARPPRARAPPGDEGPQGQGRPGAATALHLDHTTGRTIVVGGFRPRTRAVRAREETLALFDYLGITPDLDHHHGSACPSHVVGRGERCSGPHPRSSFGLSVRRRPLVGGTRQDRSTGRSHRTGCPGGPCSQDVGRGIGSAMAGGRRILAGPGWGSG